MLCTEGGGWRSEVGGRIANFERNHSIVLIENGETLTLANVPDGKIIWEKTFTEHTICRAAVDALGNYLMILFDNIIISVYNLQRTSTNPREYGGMQSSVMMGSILRLHHRKLEIV
ncbi:MAG TPA: hypothetical protein DEF89_14935 [Desulfosporosinus sp.]|nr:hypothetical protein [Desulfosporosinus sp.]